MKGQLHFFADNQFGENVQNRCNLLSLLSDRVKFSGQALCQPDVPQGTQTESSPTRQKVRTARTMSPPGADWEFARREL